MVAEPPPGFLAAVSGLSRSDGATASDYHAGRSFRRKLCDARRCSEGLTRIRLQLATYFCLHRGSFTASTARRQPRFRRNLPHPKISVKNYMSDKIATVGPVDGNSLNGTFDLTRGKFVALSTRRCACAFRSHCQCDRNRGPKDSALYFVESPLSVF